MMPFRAVIGTKEKKIEIMANSYDWTLSLREVSVPVCNVILRNLCAGLGSHDFLEWILDRIPYLLDLRQEYGLSIILVASFGNC